MDITNRYRVTVFGRYSECAITLDVPVFQDVNDAGLDRSGDVASLISELFGAPAVGRAHMETRPAFRASEKGTMKSECNSEVSVETDMDLEIRFEVPNAGAGTSPEDEKARQVIKIWGEGETISGMVEDGSIPDAVENLLRRSSKRGSGSMNANLDLRAEDLDDGRRRYTLPLGRKIDQQIENGAGVFNRGARLVGQGDIMRLVNAVFPDNLNTSLVFGAITEAGQMVMLKAYPYQADDGCMLYPVEIWFAVPDAARETIGGECRSEITITGEGHALPHRSLFQSAHDSLKSRTAAPPKPAEARELVTLERPVFQPVLRLPDIRGKHRDCLHSMGDVAMLLAGTLGQDAVRMLELKSQTISSGRFDYNIKTSATAKVGEESVTVTFSTQHPSLVKGCPKLEEDARRVIAITGSKAAVAAIAGHMDFPGICAKMRARNVSEITDKDTANPFVSEFAVKLARRIEQPLGELTGPITKAAQGDLSILLGTIFDGNASWDKVERKMGWHCSDTVVARAVVGEQMLAASFRVPNKSDYGSVSASQNEQAEMAITISGEPELVAQVRDCPTLTQICAGLNQRDVGLIQSGAAAPVPTQAAKEPGKANPADTRTAAEIEASLRKRGFVPMDRGNCPVHRDLGSTEQPKPRLNVAETAAKLSVAPRTFPPRGQGQPSRPLTTAARRRW